jgi:hypothetical protein
MCSTPTAATAKTFRIANIREMNVKNVRRLRFEYLKITKNLIITDKILLNFTKIKK